MQDATDVIWGTSPTATSVSAAVRKRFIPGLDDSITVEYGIEATVDNKGRAPREVTRVGPGGLTFYPTGDQAPTSGSFSLPAIQNGAGCTRFKYPAQVSASQRRLADSKEGWLAHVKPTARSSSGGSPISR